MANNSNIDKVNKEIDAFIENPSVEKSSEQYLKELEEKYKQPEIKATGLKSLYRKTVKKPLNVAGRFLLPSIHDRLAESELRENQILNEVTKIREQLEFTYQQLTARIEETKVLGDQFKSEILYEINKDTQKALNKEIETKVINESKIKNAKKIRLNIGCGRDIREDYINVDFRELPGVDVVADIRKLPFEKGTVDEVFTAHVIEHFMEQELIEILKYWYELLKPGGIIKTIAPNMEPMLEDYKNGKITWDELRKVTLGAQDYIGDFHYNYLSAGYVRNLVKKALPNAEVKFVTEDRQNDIAREMEFIITKPNK